MISLDWDDDRLNAAFGARARTIPPTPPDLVATVASRITSVSPVPQRGFGRLASLVGVAAVVAVAIVVGVGQVGRSTSSTSSSGSSHSASPGTAANSTSPAVIGEPISVAQALAIRNAGVDDRELIVSGFYSRFAVPCPAPVNQVANPTRIDCPAGFVWLMEQPESLSTTTGDTTSIHAPSGPAFHPAFQLVDEGNLNQSGAAHPFRATLIGHFDDRRAALCPAAETTPCVDTFIVDRVLAIDGREQPVSTLLVNTRWDAAAQVNRTIDPVTTADAIDGLVESATSGATILSRQLRTGDELGAVEPALRSDSDWTGQRLVWIVATVEIAGDRPIPRTFVVVDGTTDVVEMTAGGAAAPAPVPSPSPSATAQLTAVTDLLAHPIGVAAAIDHRDSALDSTELAVRGYAWGPAGPIACQLIRPGMPAMIQCPSFYTWIADIKPASSPDGEFARPTGPAFNLIIEPETIRGIDIFSKGPVEIVALGHFDDRRSTACGAAESTCRLNFIVDAIVDASDRRLDRPPDLSRFDPQVRPRMTIHEAIVAMGLNPTDPGIVAAFAVRKASLSELEPEIAHALELQGADIVWIVRWIAPDTAERPILWTRITIDGEPGRPGGFESWEVMRDGLVSTLRNPDAPQPQTAAPSVVASGSGP